MVYLQCVGGLFVTVVLCIHRVPPVLPYLHTWVLSPAHLPEDVIGRALSLIDRISLTKSLATCMKLTELNDIDYLLPHNIHRPKTAKMSLTGLHYSQCSECTDRTMESVYATIRLR